jgi:hypothetical protein
MGANQAEMIAKMDLHYEKLMAIMKASKGKAEDMRDDCLGKMEACLDSKESTPLERELVAVHEEDLKEEVAVETSGALKERYGAIPVRHKGHYCQGQDKDKAV